MTTRFRSQDLSAFFPSQCACEFFQTLLQPNSRPDDQPCEALIQWPTRHRFPQGTDQKQMPEPQTPAAPESWLESSPRVTPPCHQRKQRRFLKYLGRI